MDGKVDRVRVFVASPSDVTSERNIVNSVAAELNRTLGQDSAVTVDVLRWESHIAPDMGRPQALVNRQIGSYDILVGMMWKHFGSPTGHAQSGTEEEFELAYASWKMFRRPRIMFYFSQIPYALRTPEEVDQLRRVLDFKQKLQKKGITFDYASFDEFQRLVREHLFKAIKDLLQERHPPHGQATPVSVRQLFESAFQEWRSHGFYADDERLLAFESARHELDLSGQRLEFVARSLLRSGLSKREHTFDLAPELLTEQALLCIRENTDEQLVEDALSFLEFGRHDMVGRNAFREDNDDCADLFLTVAATDAYPKQCRLRALDAFYLRPVPERVHKPIQDTIDRWLDTEKDPRFARIAARVLGQLRNQRSTRTLIRLLNHSIVDVRRAAAEALRRPGTEDELTLRYQKEKTLQVRMAILHGLVLDGQNTKVRAFLKRVAARKTARGSERELARENLRYWDYVAARHRGANQQIHPIAGKSGSG